MKPDRPYRAKTPRAIAIAASTGGPQALCAMFHELANGPLPVPVFIVLHMPEGFAGIVSSQVERISGLSASVSQDQEIIRAGQIYVATSGYHLTVQREGLKFRLQHSSSPPVNFCRPSADVLLESVSAAYGGAVLGVILSGMGTDGLNGARALVEAGGEVFTQDQDSSIVWGMPGSVVRAGLSRVTASPDVLARKISLRLCSHDRSVA